MFSSPTVCVLQNKEEPEGLKIIIVVNQITHIQETSDGNSIYINFVGGQFVEIFNWELEEVKSWFFQRVFDE
jgi:hypothetical protein